MISRIGSGAKSILLLFACFLVLSASAEALPAELDVMQELVMANTDWDSAVVDSLMANSTWLPSGFLVSGAAYVDHLYGVAFYPRHSEPDFLSAVQLQAVLAAFYDKIKIEVEGPMALHKDLVYFQLADGFKYVVGEFLETTEVNTEWLGSLVRIPSQDVSYQLAEDVNLERFAQYVFAQAQLFFYLGKTDHALANLDWLLGFQPALGLRADIIVSKAQIQLMSGDNYAAYGTIAPLLEYTDQQFYEKLTPDQIMVLVTVLERADLVDMAVEMAVFSAALFPNHAGLQQVLSRLVAE